MAELHVIDGLGEEHRIPLGSAPVTFGRSEDCDLTLAEQRASRHHCTIEPMDPALGAGWRVVDNQSSNGTWLGGKPVMAAKLQDGDELEIGATLITYLGDGVEPPQRSSRAPRKAKVPWGALAAPLVLAGVAWAALGALESRARTQSGVLWRTYARDVIARADLSTDLDARRESLESLRAELAAEPGATGAVMLVDEALRKPPETADGETSEPGWKKALAAYRSDSPALSPDQRAHRLRRFLERYADVGQAAHDARDLLLGEEREAVERFAAQRRRVDASAAAALDEGRVADAMETWNGWLLSSPALTREDEKAVVASLSAIREVALRDAGDAVLQYQELLQAGRDDEARTLAEDTIARLAGTGYDAWVAARTATVASYERPTGGAKGGTPSASGRERATALRALQTAASLTRTRQFAEAAERLQGIAGGISDGTLAEELTARAGELRAEADLLARVLRQVAESARKFSPVVIDGKRVAVMGATTGGLLLGRKGTAEDAPVGSLPGTVFTHLLSRAEVLEGDLIPAAMLARDVGDMDGYAAWMRSALSVDSLVQSASLVHARVLGQKVPDGGYVPHPEDELRIITFDELKAIENAAKITAYIETFAKVVERLEKTRQAKGITKVVAAYQELEAARQHALDLINDEVKYFYPYRDRMAEYTPVSREVDGRVDLVREAWGSSAKVNAKKDGDLEKVLDEARDLRIEIEYLGGICDELQARVEAVSRYLDKGVLTVQNFFVTDADEDLLRYNDRIMAENAVVETVATDSEREQVRITNEYRKMFGHRRAVKINDQLTMAARGHSTDMARLGFFAHESPVPGKKTPMDRVRKAGYQPMGCSENIHMGSGSPLGAHNSWAHSSGHHRNLLSPAWSEMGTGRSGRHWTQNFGFRSGDELE